MIALVDYGLGNIQAIANIYRRLNIPTRVARSAAELKDADKVVLPGVGAFDWAMARLSDSGMRECLDDMVLTRGCSVLGICVGMQLMATCSEEGHLKGLGWIDARVKRFDSAHSGGPLPHMGWNDVNPKETDTLFRGIDSSYFYFLHSYYVAPLNAENVLATTDYGDEFVSAFRVDRIYGVQFHPEKSHDCGVQLLRNFAELESC
jgi:glutamine amidotransferase